MRQRKKLGAQTQNSHIGLLLLLLFISDCAVVKICELTIKPAVYPALFKKISRRHHARANSVAPALRHHHFPHRHVEPLLLEAERRPRQGGLVRQTRADLVHRGRVPGGLPADRHRVHARPERLALQPRVRVRAGGLRLAEPLHRAAHAVAADALHLQEPHLEPEEHHLHGRQRVGGHARAGLHPQSRLPRRQRGPKAEGSRMDTALRHVHQDQAHHHAVSPGRPELEDDPHFAGALRGGAAEALELPQGLQLQGPGEDREAHGAVHDGGAV